MRTKKFSLLCATTVALLAGLAVGAGVVLRHEPSFYLQGEIAPSPERKELSETFLRHFSQMLLDIKAERGKWAYSFSEAQLNSFFEEDFVRLGEEDLRKLNISRPRVVLEGDRLRFAFRYGTGFWSTVVSYDLRVWLAPKEPNVLAVEILSRRVGALPVSTHALLGQLSDLARRHNMEVSLYRHDGNPVALIHLHADRPRSTTHLECVRIDAGKLTIAGASPDFVTDSPIASKATTPSGN